MALHLENARVVFVVILLLWVIFTPDSGPRLIAPPSIAAARLARQRLAHGVLNSTKWGDFSPSPTDINAEAQYLNLTGFRKEDGYAWEDLGRFRRRCADWKRYISPPEAQGDEVEGIWQNVTGVVAGKWIRRAGSVPRLAMGYNLSQMAPEVSWAGLHSEWHRNMTGSHGRMVLQLEEKRMDARVEKASDQGSTRPIAREVSATVMMQDEAKGSSSWDMRMHGVHWPRQGAILLTTTSEKFAGIFGLPHLSPSLQDFMSSQALLNRTLDAVLRKREKLRGTDAGNPWTSSMDGPNDEWTAAPQCEYIFYLQLHPVHAHQLGVDRIDGQTGQGQRLDALVEHVEEELRHPTGARLHSLPQLRASLAAWSPDCSYWIDSKGPPLVPSVDGKHLTGMKEEVLVYEVKTWLVVFAAVLMGQLWVFKHQVRESSTPSTTGRVSFGTISVMVLADSLTFSVSTAWTFMAQSTHLASLTVVFVSFMAAMVGSGFLADVYRAQEPERRARDRAGTEWSPVTAPATASTPPSPPIIIPSDQDIDAEIAENMIEAASAVPAAGTRPTNVATQMQSTPFASVYIRLNLVHFLLLFLGAMAVSWPARLRACYVNALAFFYLSLWMPQIVRNVERNSRRALTWRFMVGQSALRMLPLAYFYLREDNVLFVETDVSTFCLLAGWVWVQLWVLAMQAVLGPRTGIPESWTRDHAWDYHPVLREDNLEAGGLPIGLVADGFSQTAASTKSGHEDGGRHARKREQDKDGDQADLAVRSIDCAICCEVLEVPVIRAGSGQDPPAATGVAGLLARRAYMLTPCRHIFHTACLEGWLRFRLQCPICREELPPL